jgi:hypothetical protein
MMPLFALSPDMEATIDINGREIIITHAYMPSITASSNTDTRWVYYCGNITLTDNIKKYIYNTNSQAVCRNLLGNQPGANIMFNDLSFITIAFNEKDEILLEYHHGDISSNFKIRGAFRKYDSYVASFSKFKNTLLNTYEACEFVMGDTMISCIGDIMTISAYGDNKSIITISRASGRLFIGYISPIIISL